MGAANVRGKLVRQVFAGNGRGKLMRQMVESALRIGEANWCDKRSQQIDEPNAMD